MSAWQDSVQHRLLTVTSLVSMRHSAAGLGLDLTVGLTIGLAAYHSTGNSSCCRVDSRRTLRFVVGSLQQMCYLHRALRHRIAVDLVVYQTLRSACLGEGWSEVATTTQVRLTTDRLNPTNSCTTTIRSCGVRILRWCSCCALEAKLLLLASLSRRIPIARILAPKLLLLEG
jgi:hypothetical protein